MKTCKLKFVLLQQQFTLMKTKEQKRIINAQTRLPPQYGESLSLILRSYSFQECSNFIKTIRKEVDSPELCGSQLCQVSYESPLCSPAWLPEAENNQRIGTRE